MKNRTSAEKAVSTFTKQELLELIEVNKAINQAQTATELLLAIRERAMNLIPFYDTGILVVEKDGLHHYDLAVTISGWDNSEFNVLMQQRENLHRIPHIGSYPEFVMAQLEKQNAPSIVDWELVVQQWEHPFFPDIKALGYKEAMVTLLKSGGKTLGTFWLNSLQKNNFKKEQFPIFQAVAEQVSIAVADILVNEELLAREKEKELLYNIASAIANIQDRISLMKFILHKVKQVFDFYDVGLLVLNPDGINGIDWAVDTPQIDPSLANYEAHRKKLEIVPYRDSLLEKSVKQVEQSGKPLIIKFDDQLLAENPEMKAVLEIEKKYGFKETLFTYLKCGEKLIGTFNINSLTDNHFQATQLTLFQAIADQIAVAVSNILAKEEILFRENEKSILLSISEAIASINNRKQLLKVIYKRIQPIFPFDNAGLYVIDVEKDQIYEILDGETFPDGLQQQLTKQHQLGPWPLSSSNFQSWWMQDEITINTLLAEAELAKDHVGYEQFEAGLAHGLKQLIAGPLKVNGKKIGALSFNSKTEGLYTTHHLPMFKSISEQIGVALANILANEELLAREKEKELLYNIASAIANIKDRLSLMKFIMAEVKSIFNFYDVGLLVLDKDGDKGVDWAVQYPEIDLSESNYHSNSLNLAKTQYKNSLGEKSVLEVEAAGHPLIYKINEQLKNDNPDLKELLQSEISFGFKETLFTYLKCGNKIVGTFNINSLNDDHFHPSQFHLFQAVADLIAVAVANILANEEILDREKEKSISLSISEDVASIRDSGQLFKIMTERLDTYMDFDHAVIMHLDKEKKNYQHLFSTIPGFQSSLRPHEQPAYPITSTMAAMIKTGNFKICHIEALLKKNPDNRGLVQLQQLGICELMAVPLKYAGDILGFLMLYSKSKATYTKENTAFIVAVSNQLSVAVSNVLAYEALKESADEIGRLNKQLQAQNAYLVHEVEQVYNFEEMIGQNPKFEDVCRNISLVAKTDSTVLILGETGTGKELVARAIHNNSPRKNKPLIKLNCAALPVNLIESELFGHERGAFTGAIDKRVGKFELAHGSTLFLDEVGELPLELQAKLLRALQEKEIERLGSNKTLQIDVRIIAATNRDLLKEVQAGTFRQDLYYRLHIFPLTLPPLRERKEDIPLLALHFVERYAKKMGKKIQGFSSSAMQEMMGYNWPGNIRELEHVIERCVILSQTKLIQELNLPDVSKPITAVTSPEFVLKTWQEQERDYILEVLKITKGNVKGKGGAAELLQLPPSTLQSKMLKLGIKRKHYIE